MNIQKLGIVQNSVYFSNRQISVKNSSNSIYSDNRSTINSLNFLGNYNQPIVKKSIDVPIADIDEFREVMERVYDAKTEKNNILWMSRNYKKIFPEYRYASEIEMGLLPYCGRVDHSDFINMYLSGRLSDKKETQYLDGLLPKDMDSCIDVIRALDYSLKNLDKEFGTYKGIVYRNGYMSEGTGQYFSTSTEPMFPFVIDSWYDFNPDKGYSVIRLKDGHKIYKFQEKMRSEYADNEKEVLTPREAKFKRVLPNEMDEELIRGRNTYLRYLLPEISDILLDDKKNDSGFNKEAFLNSIAVYDEI